MNAAKETIQQNLPTIEPVEVSIYAKLMRARIAFHQIDIQKTGYNKFSGYSYFEMGDFLLPAMNCMSDQGLIPVISFSFEYATMRVHDIESGKFFDITSPMSSANLKACHEVQNLGAVETYERRYLWMTLMELVESDQAETIKPAPELANAEQIAAMYDYKESGLMTSGQLAWLDTASDKITADQAEYVLEKLKEKEDE